MKVRSSVKKQCDSCKIIRLLEYIPEVRFQQQPDRVIGRYGL